MATQTMSRPNTDRQLNYLELLEEAVNEPGKLEESFKAFHNFSLTNRLLACMQLRQMGKPITPIKTFNQWNTMNRHVNKGEKALELCMPYIKKYTSKNEQGEEEQKAYTKFTFKKYWFSYSQTSGEEFTPEPIAWDRDKALNALNIELVDFQHINGNIGGYAKTNKNQVTINPLNKHYYSTLFHELAHVLLHSGACTLDKETKEVEAESVAMLCNATLNLDDELVYNRGYIQSYIKDKTINEKTAQRIISATDKILKSGVL